MVDTTQNDFLEKYKVQQASLSRLINGKAKSCNGWVLI